MHRAPAGRHRIFGAAGTASCRGGSLRNPAVVWGAISDWLHRWRGDGPGERTQAADRARFMERPPLSMTHEERRHCKNKSRLGVGGEPDLLSTGTVAAIVLLL